MSLDGTFGPLECSRVEMLLSGLDNSKRCKVNLDFNGQCKNNNSITRFVVTELPPSENPEAGAQDNKSAPSKEDVQ